MNRNRNVDILRAMAILLIIVYHCYILGGSPWSSHHKLNVLLSFGGELGVTLFFVLSGFGIFYSLLRQEKNGMPIKWTDFMRKRCVRIMPQYYFCIGFLLIFQSTAMISAEGVGHIFAYGLFLQNLTPATHGSINGALWAIATIFQFYLIAVLLFKLIKRNWILTGILSIVITIVSKYVIYHLIIPTALPGNTNAFFVYGRELISALDNFVLGMLAAMASVFLIEKLGRRQRICIGLTGVTVYIIILLVVSYYFSVSGLYVDSIRGYVGHTVLAFLMSGLVVCVSVLPQRDWKILKPLYIVADYQYGMYLWHMPIIGYLYNGAPAIKSLVSKSFALYIICIILVVTVFGWFVSKCVDSVKYTKLFEKKSKGRN